MNKHLTNLPAGRPQGSKTFNRSLAKAFGLAVRKLRVNKKLTQMDLGYLADVPGNHIGKIERGENLPNFAIIVKLAHALNISAAKLVSEAEKAMGEEPDAGIK